MTLEKGDSTVRTRNGALGALYYPFSRCINESSLKQLLLVFDKIGFLDPVDDEAWRAKLYRDLEAAEDQRFGKYRGLFDAVQDLLAEGVMVRYDPEEIPDARGPMAAASAISDLLDESWVASASRPDLYQLPHRKLGVNAAATWQAFPSKMPRAFIEALFEENNIRHHLIEPGPQFASWTLSYEAGSAAAMSVHLAASEHLGFAPVTDSSLHHELLLKKLIRGQQELSGSLPIDPAVIEQLSHKIALTTVADLLGHDELARVSFEMVLRFREDTSGLRGQLVEEVSNRLSAIKEEASVGHLGVSATRIRQDLHSELRKYQAEMRSVRDKLWPSIVSSTVKSFGSGSLAAVSMNYIGGPGYALAASVVVASLALLNSTLDLRAERRKLEGSVAPGIAYLSEIGGRFS